MSGKSAGVPVALMCGHTVTIVAPGKRGKDYAWCFRCDNAFLIASKNAQPKHSVTTGQPQSQGVMVVS